MVLGAHSLQARTGEGLLNIQGHKTLISLPGEFRTIQGIQGIQELKESRESGEKLEPGDITEKKEFYL